MTSTKAPVVFIHGIDDVTSHCAKIIDGLPAPPILIGHSFGGLIAEKLLGMDRGAAAIAIDAAQIKGVLQLPLSSCGARCRSSRTRPTGTRRSR
jgi:pimeloyl-ACP methyl ester carboxylesterase